MTTRVLVYSTVSNLEWNAIHCSIRQHVRDSICHNTRHDINDVLDWIVIDAVFVSVSNNVNAELQDYKFK